MEKPQNPISTQTGVYIFKDKDDNILYVGKAKNLKSRVKSYFSSSLSDRPWTQVMVKIATDIETIVVNSEYEALILEAQLIKQYKPKYNIRLADDKAYPYIKITTSEAYPRALIVRKILKGNDKYFGPYLSTRYLGKTLQFIRQVYGIHLSKQPIKPTLKKPCFYCQLDNNLCPLVGEITPELYCEQAKKAMEFLQGNRKHIIKELEDRIKLASKNLEYEKAAVLRDQLMAIEKVRANQQYLVDKENNYDVIAVAQSFESAIVIVLKVRDGVINSQKEFYFDDKALAPESELIREFLITFYPQLSEIPAKVIIAENIEDSELVEKLVGETLDYKFELKLPRGNTNRLMEIAKKNAISKLELSLLKRNDNSLALFRLQNMLELDNLPTRVEALDISNYTSGAVGTIVTYVNGKPDKNEYRRYKIKTVAGQNDFAMVEEVTKRRFMDTERPTPDIFLIDGGPQQLAFANMAISNNATRPKIVIALAKKPDRIYLSGKNTPLDVERNDQGLRFLSMVRDEVHRFSIKYSRQKQIKKSLEI